MAKLSTLLDQIDNGTLLLPEFQRGYVWNRDQVRGLMHSLYQGFPVGGLLLWETDVDPNTVRGSAGGHGVRLLLLDGQQRITSLYGVCRGAAPRFFDGDPKAFTKLYFNVDREEFQFYGPTKMGDDPHWVDVTRLFREDLQPFVATLSLDPNFSAYMQRLVRLRGILEREFHEEKITGPHMTVDTVVEIFNRVNSGGTTLSKGDLALARLCAESSDLRERMRHHLATWQGSGYSFTLDWLLRNATAVATGRSQFRALERVTAAEFRQALEDSAVYIGRFLEALSGRLGLDHDRVLMARYAIPVVSRLLHLNGGQFTDARDRDKTLYWYVHAALWGRFAGSTETVLAQDYETLAESGVDGLIASLERSRGGNLTIQPHDFEGSSRGARFYPLLYLLTRALGAKDFGSGLPLHAEMLGKLTSLQVHHIFPKAQLYKHGYERGTVNAIANFCFLTQETNLEVGARLPEEYLAEVAAKHPGVLASQWIPEDPELWKVERYPDFLVARRELLATAAASFLDKLRSGAGEQVAPAAGLAQVSVILDDAHDARATQISQLVDELRDAGCAEPALDAEIADPATGLVLSIAEAFWPDGLQPGQGAPVVLELDPDEADLPRLEELGYRVFTSPDALRGYVERRNDEAAGETDENPSPSDTSTNPVAAEFHADMGRIYERAKQEAHYTAGYFLSMLAEHGGLATAQRLLHAPAVSDGFAALWERNRLDLTVEALVSQPKYADLFTAEELGVARYRLEQFGYH
ncbi:DUF262 domain-containing protein [Actinocatenispora sera]|uniref:GmrSD restriction endonuclease domain-containing protein n=1 Tax=Actinocatenispora sera TaxID=390989 RepID=UPI0033D35198